MEHLYDDNLEAEATDKDSLTVCQWILMRRPDWYGFEEETESED